MFHSMTPHSFQSVVRGNVLIIENLLLVFFYLLAAITTSITAIWSHQLLVPTQTLNKMTQMFIQRKNKMIRIVATDSVI